MSLHEKLRLVCTTVPKLLHPLQNTSWLIENGQDKKNAMKKEMYCLEEKFRQK
jgi:hypothetical protein